MNKFLFLIFLFSPLLFVGNFAYAATSCQPVYGGGQNCVTTGNVLINKTVQNPSTLQFVDNLSVNDPKFSPNQLITFQISLTNKDNTTILQTAVRDIFPGFVSFTSGAGNFDANTKTLTFTTDNLAPNETRNFILQGKITENLPDGITCVINQATATTNTGQMNQDNAQFCIQKSQITTKGGLPILPPSKATTTPATGPEMFALIGLLPAGLSGWFLRRKSFIKQGGTR